ncbi:MAG TPA: lactate utilization protein B/C [Gemmatimonadetes bacterium]|nr:lactate utilization protein B/C [Gemmatimonadota bacterium]|tara:strand:+ start:132 stop:668 length:537 start_codon:yes stop_codon:yes gene_type:complete
MHSGDPTEQFTEMFEKAGGEVVSFNTQAEASLWVRGFLADFDSLSLGELARNRLNEDARPDDWIKETDPSAAEAGVSLAFGAVAETGSLMMTPQDGRRAQLLPPVHVVFLDQAKIYDTLSEGLLALKNEVLPGDNESDGLPSALGLHSGPSKSADIGQVLVKGVHGPGRVITVIVKSE